MGSCKIILDTNVMCRFTNGLVINGLEQTIQMYMSHMIVWATDTKIKEHRILFGSGNWTCTNLIIEVLYKKHGYDEWTIFETQ